MYAKHRRDISATLTHSCILLHRKLRLHTLVKVIVGGYLRNGKYNNCSFMADGEKMLASVSPSAAAVARLRNGDKIVELSDCHLV